jgi:rhodanese-related sulfurtransferase
MFGIPEISVQDVAAKRADGDEFILLDVREAHELNFATLGEGVTHVPLSNIAEQRLDALPENIRSDKEADIIVFCHHGSRSAQVAGWLRQQGWANVLNMAGGIDAYALQVDAAVGRY